MNVKINHENNTDNILFKDLKSKQLDLTSVKFLRNKFKNIVLKNIALDFYNIEYIDSAIVGFIVELFNEIKNHNGEFKIIPVHPTVYEILEMTHLTKYIKIERV